MPELMTKHDAIEYLLYMKHDVQAKSSMDIALDTAIKALKQPTIEPEVRHGRWIFVCEETMHDGWKYRKYKCSECSFSTVETINFCQKCGARMDGGSENDT